jgi:hypothetical protein
MQSLPATTEKHLITEIIDLMITTEGGKLWLFIQFDKEFTGLRVTGTRCGVHVVTEDLHTPRKTNNAQIKLFS